jgi:hypothetical protein
MKKYLILLLALTLTGCAGYRKQQQRAERFYQQYPLQLAGLCAQAFPVKQELKPGRDTLLQTDTLQLAVKCPPSVKDTVIFTRYQQQTKLRVDTLYHTRTAVEDSLRTQVLVLAQTQAATEQRKEALTAKSRGLLWLVVGLALMVLFLAVLFVKVWTR